MPKYSCGENDAVKDPGCDNVTGNDVATTSPNSQLHSYFT